MIGERADGGEKEKGGVRVADDEGRSMQQTPPVNHHALSTTHPVEGDSLHRVGRRAQHHQAMHDHQIIQVQKERQPLVFRGQAEHIHRLQLTALQQILAPHACFSNVSEDARERDFAVALLQSR